VIVPAIIATVTGAIQAVYGLPIGEKSMDAIELRRDEIIRCEPMAKEETETLFLFASASKSRTAKSRDHWKHQLREPVEITRSNASQSCRVTHG
jgi:hypothetical protein